MAEFFGIEFQHIHLIATFFLIKIAMIIFRSYYNKTEISVNKRESKFVIPENSGALKELKKNPKDNDETIKFKLIEKKVISYDTINFIFEIPNNLHLGINICEHIAIDAVIKTKEFPDGEDVSRKYTPISTIHTKGKIEVLAKIYFKDTHPNFPEGGKMTQHLNDMKIGESIDFRGPFGKLKYLGDGHFEQLVKFGKPLVKKHFKKLIMLSGGTGITPMYQVIQAVNENNDNTEILLIFGNKSTKDFLLKEELDDIMKSENNNIKVVFTIDRAEEGWTGDVGFITKDMIKKYSDDYANDSTFVLACGPPIMVNGLKKAVKEMGVKDDNFYNF